MNILLVYPKYPDTFWSFKHSLKFISKRAAFPPLGLLTVASLLPEEWNKKLVDMNVTSLDDEAILWADLIFIGAMIVQKESVRNVIERCKKFSKKVVAGGPLFTTGYSEFEDVDYLVLNEAEVTLPIFLRDFSQGKSGHLYSSEQKPDITKTPIPIWTLINFNDYAAMSIQYSRGCPYNCEFCDIIIMNGRVPRTKTPEQLICELESLYDANYRGSIFIVDDNFIGNKEQVKHMLSFLIKWQKEHDYPFTFFTEASTNLADDIQLLRMMVAANFFKVFLGIETTDINGLKECSKLQNTQRDLLESVKIIHQHGLQVMGGFIVGFDNDNENTFEAQIRFIQRAGIVTAMVGLLNALPQTRLWHRLRAEKRLVSETSGENTDCNLNFIPKMEKNTLINGYKKILQTIYSPKQYYKRIDVLLSDYNPRMKSRISRNMLKAFLKSIWSIGVISRERLLYWKLIIKTLFTRINSFGTAVELAIHRQHFEMVLIQGNSVTTAKWKNL